MSRVGSVLSACLFLAVAAAAQVELSYYLPGGVTYDERIPRPRDLIGHEVGDGQVRHDSLVLYMQALAQASARVRIETYGRTHEGRALQLLTISTPSNLERIDDLRAQHVAAIADPAKAAADLPLVVWMGYSVHGDESSGANASLAVAYHLAAAQGEEIESMLARTIILLDPCINPDGLSRFAQWANQHRGRIAVADPDHREHRQGWLTGRTNHYWFDLNRDWLLLTQPESRARLARYRAWRPNVVTDFHEMGSDGTYFFQPGVRSRKHPLIPPRNAELTAAIARVNAARLDGIGSLYFTEEQFDDFYFGKGSTYPDLDGAVGILFEQASSRGQVQDTRNGVLSFPFTIRNQVTASLGTLDAADRMRAELLDWQREFRRSAHSEAAADPVKAWIFAEPADPMRIRDMLDLLTRHDIRVHRLGRRLEIEGRDFAPETAWIVPGDQDQYRLAKALFERRVEFADEAFYDISAWSLPAAFGVDCVEVPAAAFDADLLGARRESGAVDPAPAPVSLPAEGVVAYAFEWRGQGAPRALYRLLDAGVVVRAATRGLTIATVGDGRAPLAPGSIVIPLALQSLAAPELRKQLESVASANGLQVLAATSGLTPEGVDLGSSTLVPVAKPLVAVLVGEGIPANDAGEIWFELDQRIEMPVSLVETESLVRGGLSRYTHLVLAGGAGGLDRAGAEELNRWVKEGGVLIGTEGACRFLEQSVLQLDGDRKKAPEGGAAESKKKPELRSWADRGRQRALGTIPGTIFSARLDRSHPLAFGMPRDRVHFFRASTLVLLPSKGTYGNVAIYDAKPLHAGYCSAENLEAIAGTTAVASDRLGRGTVIRFADDPVFRAYFRGSSRLFTNSLFFGALAE